jgi:hypothetical protein
MSMNPSRYDIYIGFTLGVFLACAFGISEFSDFKKHLKVERIDNVAQEHPQTVYGTCATVSADGKLLSRYCTVEDQRDPMETIRDQ